MLDRRIKPYSLERGLLPRSHDIPPNTAVRQMIQCRKALCEQKWRLKGRGGCDAERQVLGHGGHGGYRLYMSVTRHYDHVWL